MRSLIIKSNCKFCLPDNGSVMLCNPTKPNLENSVELIGPNVDAIYRIGCNGKEIFTASRDGKIRKYLFD